MVLVGNKMDLIAERCVTPEDGANLAVVYGMPFFETSARLGTNVEEAFNVLIQEWARKTMNGTQL